jgi:hypothetical protein
VFAINKTPRIVPLHVNFDGSFNVRLLKHQALSFANLNELRSFGMDESVLTEAKSVSGIPEGVVLLPPLSLNRFDLP